MKTLSFRIALATALLAGVQLIAQSTTDGAIGGTVFDPNGAVIPQAQVTVTNNATDAKETVTTDASGYYRAIHLEPGVYTAAVSASGFSGFKAEQVIVQVGTLTDVSPHLAVGGSSESVDVTAEAPQVNVTSGDFAPVVNETDIDNLPINSPRSSRFALLTPGVVNNSSGFGLLSFRGISTLLNNVTIDGADNNQALFSEERGRTRAGYSTPRVAVQEFQVNTSNYSAEYGRSAGGVINTVTKSGTNQIHGEAYFYDQSNAWASRNPFTTIATQTSPGVFSSVPFKPTDYRQIGGFGIGGPIIKDKVFAYVAYDWYKRVFPGVAIPAVPGIYLNPITTTKDSANANGQLGVFAGQTGLTLAAAQTLYNADQTAFTSELGVVPRKGNQEIFFPKIDWLINQKNHVFFELNRMRWASPAGIQTATTVNDAVDSFGNDYVKDTWGVAKLETLVTSTFSNEVRFQYGRDFEYEFSQPTDPYEQNNVLKSGAYTNPNPYPPEVSLSGFLFGTPTFLERAAYPDERRTQIADSLTWIRGNHSLKFGADINRVEDLTSNLFEQYGLFSYSTNDSNPLINYFSDLYKPKGCTSKGVAVPCYTTFGQGFGPAGVDFTTFDYAFFGQDDWKFSPRLTLNFGLRYEYEEMPKSTPFANPAVPQTSVLPKDRNNFGPRVGFAYDVFGDGKTALRGGYGMYYGRIIGGAIFNALLTTGVPASQLTYSINNTTAGAPVFPQVFAAAPTAGANKPSLAFFDHHMQNPEIHEIDLTLQHEIGWGTVVSLSYLGSLGRELPDYDDTNLSPPTQTITYNILNGGPLVTAAGGTTYTTPLWTARPNANYGQMIDIFSGGNSSYHALALQVNHRLNHDVQFSANYTYSHAQDYGQNENTTGTTSQQIAPNNIKLDYGNSPYDVPNRLVFDAVANSPWHLKGIAQYFVNDWELSPIVQVQNGLPYSITTSGTAPGAVTSGGGINGSNGRFGIDILGRGTFRQPYTETVDLRIGKNFTYREKYKLEVFGEAFNLLNHENVTAVSTAGYSVGTTNGAPSLTYQLSNGVPTFGTATAANNNYAYSTRQIELSARVHF